MRGEHMVRTKQGGSILGFVIVGSVLAVLLIGGAYFVRHQLAANTDLDDEPVVTQNSAGDSGDTTKDAKEDAKPSDDESKQAESGNDEEQAEGVVTLPGSAENPTDESEEKDEEDAPAVTDLPQTGPADAVLSSVLLGGVAGVIVAYKRSRDAVSSL